MLRVGLRRTHGNRVFEADLGKQVPHAMLGELLDVVGMGPAMEDNPAGMEFDAQVTDPASGTLRNVLFDFVLHGIRKGKE